MRPSRAALRGISRDSRSRRAYRQECSVRSSTKQICRCASAPRTRFSGASMRFAMRNVTCYPHRTRTERPVQHNGHVATCSLPCRVISKGRVACDTFVDRSSGTHRSAGHFARAAPRHSAQQQVASAQPQTSSAPQPAQPTAPAPAAAQLQPAPRPPFPNRANTVMPSWLRVRGEFRERVEGFENSGFTAETRRLLCAQSRAAERDDHRLEEPVVSGQRAGRTRRQETGRADDSAVPRTVRSAHGVCRHR